MGKAGLSVVTSGDSVLVVEDELRVRDMLARALKEMGFTATLAGTAEAAGKAMESGSFDIVILDLNLPGMDGLSFLKSLRAKQNHIEAIILTGFGDLEAAKTAIHLDVVDFITKPYALGTLEVALDRARKRIRARVVAGQEISEEARLSFAEEERPPRAPAFEEKAEAGEGLEEVERREIIRVLEKNRGNRAATAAELGISLRKLYYRLGEYQRKGLLSF